MMTPAPEVNVPDYVKDQRLHGVRVYLGMPTSDEMVHQSAVTLKRSCSQLVGRVAAFHIESSTDHMQNFNRLYSAALNARKTHGITHFLMIHSDIHPLESGWLDKMVAIAAAVEADVLSAVVPLKSPAGLTSTAIERPTSDGGFSPPRRLTMHEIMVLPETFTEPLLLLNTGLMLVDLRKPWAEDVCFEFESGIVKGADGEFKATSCPEDWNFSRKVRAKGGSMWATRAIPLIHRGKGEYRNDSAWGSVLTER